MGKRTIILSDDVDVSFVINDEDGGNISQSAVAAAAAAASGFHPPLRLRLATGINFINVHIQHPRGSQGGTKIPRSAHAAKLVLFMIFSYCHGFRSQRIRW